jgi:hypothetical protein
MPEFKEWFGVGKDEVRKRPPPLGKLFWVTREPFFD